MYAHEHTWEGRKEGRGERVRERRVACAEEDSRQKNKKTVAPSDPHPQVVVERHTGRRLYLLEHGSLNV